MPKRISPPRTSQNSFGNLTAIIIVPFLNPNISLQASKNSCKCSKPLAAAPQTLRPQIADKGVRPSRAQQRSEALAVPTNHVTDHPYVLRLTSQAPVAPQSDESGS